MMFTSIAREEKEAVSLKVVWKHYDDGKFQKTGFEASSLKQSTSKILSARYKTLKNIHIGNMFMSSEHCIALEKI